MVALPSTCPPVHGVYPRTRRRRSRETLRENDPVNSFTAEALKIYCAQETTIPAMGDRQLCMCNK